MEASEQVRPQRQRVAPMTKALFGVLGVTVVGYAISLMVRANGVTWTWLDGWGVPSFELVASLLVLVRARVSPYDRRYCLLLGLGGVSWSIGDFAMTIESLNGTPATFSLANVLWAGFFPLAYLGVMVLMQRDVKKLTAANYLDGVVAGLVTFAVLVAFAFHWIANTAGGGTEFAAVNLVYPVGDLLLFGLTLIGIMMLPKGRRLRWALIGAAGLINAAGDISALFGGIVATHVGFVLNAGAWPESLFLIAAAVWLTPDSGQAPQETTASGFFVPTVASIIALFVLFVGSLVHTSQVGIGLATATLVAAGARFYLALGRMHELSRERELERAHAADLERESREAMERAVHRYSVFASQVADGDLTATIDSEGDDDLQELAGSLNRMVDSLAEISSQIQLGVRAISETTGEILSSANEHSSSASQQSAAITQATATVNDLRAAADEMAQRASEVAREAGDSVKVSDEGSEAIQAIGGAMEEIRERVDGIASEIAALSARTQQIGDITATVNELADRSKLLALNAGIEAARAGEHGRGFAVVADQVKDLSEQSKDATARIETILNEVREATAGAVRASEAGTAVVDQGLKLTERAAEGVISLTETIRLASAAAEKIAGAAQEQSAGMDQIAASMQELERSTANFLAGAQQSQHAAQGLGELSAELGAATDRYRVAPDVSGFNLEPIAAGEWRSVPEPLREPEPDPGEISVHRGSASRQA